MAAAVVLLPPWNAGWLGLAMAVSQKPDFDTGWL
jgi:hypothetical protein